MGREPPDNKLAGKGRRRLPPAHKRTGRRDIPDIRDRMYEPTLAALPALLKPPKRLHLLDQGAEGACTGFAVAAAINRLLASNTRLTQGMRKRRVSPYMLYALARRYDEWSGEKYEGSSLRGALRAFYHCGACSEAVWPEMQADVTPESVRDARRTQLGAYYRLRPILSDYHAALHEAGCVVASAKAHAGWDHPASGKIPVGVGTEDEGHAFLIVGFDDKGFWIQNSWGPEWGEDGLAHWRYEDWAQNIMDAWVMQLAAPAPRFYGTGITRGDRTSFAAEARAKAPPERNAIAGHFVHLENGGFEDKGKYWSTIADVQATAKMVAESDKYRHFVFYTHGGLNTTEDAAVRARAMLDVFKANGIYPYSVFYDTGLVETLCDVIRQQGEAQTGLTGGIGEWWDGRLERALRPAGRALWSEIKRDASLPFELRRAGEASLIAFRDAMRGAANPPKVHLIGHSAGSILLGHLLGALERLAARQFEVSSVSLLAPACSIEFYKQHFLPRIDGSVDRRVAIGQLDIYNLDDEREQDDNVIGVYRKSLLYLVSNAFEERAKLDLLGMQKFAGKLNESKPRRLSIFDTKTHPVRTRSRSHGGFDNDAVTMNSVLRCILGAPPARRFTKEDLEY